MARFKPDLRATWRRLGGEAQQENAERLLGGQAVTGGGLAPDVVPKGSKRGRQKRLRFQGVRFSLREVSSKAGFASGEMYKDLTRKSNVKATRTGFKIKPSEDQLLKTRAFNAGRRGKQVDRPFSGLTEEFAQRAAFDVAVEYRNQSIAHIAEEVDDVG